jgi:GNAT superfamily N-acetyltransferase
MQETIIRPYRKEDRVEVRDIAWETAFMGEPADIFFDDKELLADFLTLYFTDYEPGSCFVAEYQGKVIGYIIGARDPRRLRRALWSITPKLFLKAVIRGVFFKKKNLDLIFHCIASFFKNEFNEKDFSVVYPAVLHINLKNGFRGLEIGSRLMTAYLGYLADQKIAGVRLATMSQKAKPFFMNQGFELLHEGHRSYFKYLVNKDVPVYIFGKS